MLPGYKNHQSNMVIQFYLKNLAKIRYFLFVIKEGMESLARIRVFFPVNKEGLNKGQEAIGKW